MGYQPLERLLPQANFSVYKLVKMASKRAMALADGKPKLVEVPTTTKTATIALDEIAARKVILKEVVDKNPPSKKKSAQSENLENNETVEPEQNA